MEVSDYINGNAMGKNKKKTLKGLSIIDAKSFEVW